MGDVFLALHGREGFEKLCVVKRLTADTLDNPERIRRFRRESEIARTLSHGAIAQTLAIDEVDGEPFIAQEFIEGRTVTQLLAAARGADQRAKTVVLARLRQRPVPGAGGPGIDAAAPANVRRTLALQLGRLRYD